MMHRFLAFAVVRILQKSLKVKHCPPFPARSSDRSGNVTPKRLKHSRVLGDMDGVVLSQFLFHKPHKLLQSVANTF